LNHPHIGVLKPETGKDIRMLVFGQYLIFYRVKADVVEILRVLHDARKSQPDA